MGDLRNLGRQVDRMAAGTMALAAGGLSIGTDTTTVQTTAAVPHIIDGEFMTDLPAADPQGSLGLEDADTVLNPDADTPQKALYLFSVDRQGNVTVRETAAVNPNGDPAYASRDGKIARPETPEGECAFGGIIVETDASTPFTPGTTALNAAGITTTYVDMAHVPADRR